MDEIDALPSTRTAIVPVAATKEMLDAARRIAPRRDGKPMPDQSILAIWSAMVAVGRSYG